MLPTFRRVMNIENVKHFGQSYLTFNYFTNSYMLWAFEIGPNNKISFFRKAQAHEIENELQQSEVEWIQEHNTVLLITYKKSLK